LADDVRHHLRGLDHGVRVAHRPDGDLLGGLVPVKEGEVLAAGAGAFEGDNVRIQL
jgi:hypothetical protein